MYAVPYISKTRTLTNLRMRLEQIGIVQKRIVAKEEQGVP